jgi:hypothetical protein
MSNCGKMLEVHKSTAVYGTPQRFVHSVPVASDLIPFYLDGGLVQGDHFIHFISNSIDPLGQQAMGCRTSQNIQIHA